MYKVDSGASLHMMEENPIPPLERKPIRRAGQQLLGDPNREWHRPFHERGDGLRPGARHSPLRDVCGGFAFGIGSWTIVR